MSAAPKPSRLRNYLLAGVFTAIPVWITWVIFEFVVTQLSALGRPGAAALSEGLRRYAPGVSEALGLPWFQNLLAVFVTLGSLILLGWLATLVVGRRLIALAERMLARIPLVEKIYGASKALLGALQQQPEGAQKVVLIAFPHPGMRTVGFVMRTLTDAGNGQQLAAVYVPTTPNPTSGYLEIVPVDDLVPTDWTFEEAMSFVISGGSVAPERVSFGEPPRGAGSVSIHTPDKTST